MAINAVNNIVGLSAIGKLKQNAGMERMIMDATKVLSALKMKTSLTHANGFMTIIVIMAGVQYSHTKQQLPPPQQLPPQLPPPQLPPPYQPPQQPVL